MLLARSPENSVISKTEMESAVHDYKGNHRAIANYFSRMLDEAVGTENTDARKRHMFRIGTMASSLLPLNPCELTDDYLYHVCSDAAVGVGIPADEATLRKVAKELAKAIKEA